MELQSARAAMRGEIVFTDGLLSALQRENCQVTCISRIESSTQPAWFVRFRPQTSLTHRFGLCEELLLLAVGGEASWPEVQASQSHLQQATSTLELDLMLVVDTAVPCRVDPVG